LGIHELQLGVTKILTILVQPKPSIKKTIYKEEGGDFFPNLGHVSVMSPKQVCDKKSIPFVVATCIVWLMGVTSMRFL